MSGFYVMPRLDGSHDATPIEGSCYSEKTQHPSDLKAISAYPVIAVCAECYGRIRLSDKRQVAWVHVPAEPEQM